MSYAFQIFKAITPEGYDTHKVVMVVLQFIVRLDQRQRKYLMEYATFKDLTWKDISKILMAEQYNPHGDQSLHDVEYIWQPNISVDDEDFAQMANEERRQYNARTGYSSFSLLRTLVNLRPEQLLAYTQAKSVDAGCNTRCLDNFSLPATAICDKKTERFLDGITSYPAWCLPGAGEREIKKGFTEFSNLTLKEHSKAGAVGQRSSSTHTSANAAPQGKKRLGTRPRGRPLGPTPVNLQKKRRRQVLTSEDEAEDDPSHQDVLGGKVDCVHTPISGAFKRPRSAESSAESQKQTQLRTAQNGQQTMKNQDKDTQHIVPRNLGHQLQDSGSHQGQTVDSFKSRLLAVTEHKQESKFYLNLSGLVLAVTDALELASSILKHGRRTTVHLQASK